MASVLLWNESQVAGLLLKELGDLVGDTILWV